MSLNKVPLVIRTIPGIFLMFAIAFFAKGGEDFGFYQWRGLETYFAANPYSKKLLIDILHLNYILLSIIIGMLMRNILTIPRWAAPGVRTSSLFMKMGVILLGSLYSVVDVARLGGTAIILVLTFIVFTVLFTLWLGRKTGMNPEAAAVLSAGTSICGVSAIVAAAPAVRAKTTDVVYSIATILSFGLVSLFIFPLLGTLLDLSPHQFGVWAGTGIVNSGQVLAVCLAFDPGSTNHVSESLKTGEIYNLTRVIFLPFVVLALAVYSSRTAQLPEDDVNINTGLWSRFPVFVLGFLVVVVLTSFGFLGSTSPPSHELRLIHKLYSWLFAIGLAGLGMQISFNELRKAGGKPLIVGSAAACLKALLVLIIVLLFVDKQP
ncbi:YeiH family protein [Desulfotomaculum nigrificans]|uniref:YeiH family protein n=1 Tax=Desulfotomaculum nigrificans TaxID=1565 RepID=UPI00030AD716|nr:putative sulfate exporter family transporter [Desulfotomaculum nigrificans]